MLTNNSSIIKEFQQWLRRRSPGASTPRHYGSDLKLFFDQVGKEVAEITPKDVDSYIYSCQSSGHAVRTINRRLAALRGLYRYLSLMHADAPVNPVIPQRHYLRRGRRLPRDVADSDVEKLFAVMENSRDRAMFLLMLRSGLRVGEVRTLDMSDLYLNPSGDHLARIWVRGKGGCERMAYLSDQTLVTLAVWLTDRPLSCQTEAVFPNRFRGRFSVTGIQYRLAHYCGLAGLWVTCHQLRHVFARHLVEANVPITSIQKLLGHARLRTTEIYLHISNPLVQSHFRQAVATMNERLCLGQEQA